MRILAMLAALSLMACSDPGTTADGSIVDAATDVSSDDTSVPAIDAAIHDAGRDARVDSGTDASASDAGHDSSMADASISDAGVDAADAAPPCACSSGPCCDGCNFRTNAHACGTNEPFPRSCGGSSMWCGSRALGLSVAQETTYCSGSSSACNGNTVDTSYSVNCSEPTPGDFQQYGVCMPAEGELPARCALNCGF